MKLTSDRGRCGTTSRTVVGTSTVALIAASLVAIGPASAAAPRIAAEAVSSATTYASAVLADSPSYYLRLGEAAGSSDVTNEVPSGPTGAYESAATPGVAGALAGDPDTAVSGDGTGPIAEVDAANMPMNDTSRSVELWEKTTTTTEQTLMSYGEAYGSRNLFTLTMTGSATGTSTIDLYNWFTTVAWTVPTALADGTWHQIVITYIAGAGDATVYVDGTTAGPQGFSGGGTPNTAYYYNANNPLLFVGADADTPGKWPAFNGSLDELAVYPTALTPAQIDTHFQAAESYPLVATVVTGAETGSGSISCHVGSASAGPCADTYAKGTTVVLTALPDPDSIDPTWTGCDSVSSDRTQCTVAMNAVRTVSVAFTHAPLLTAATLSADRSGSGAVVSATPGSTIACNTGLNICSENVPYVNGAPGVESLNAIPAVGSYLSGWSHCDDDSEVTCQVTMGSAITVTASFQTCPLSSGDCAPFTGPDSIFSSICPLGGTSAGGSDVKLTGHGLVGGNRALFGSTEAQTVSASSDNSELTVRTPAHAAGAVAVTLEDSQSGSQATFTYESAAPTLSALNPSAVYHVGTGAVTITGTDLFDVSAVHIGSATVSTVQRSCDGTSLTFTPPDVTDESVTNETVSVTTPNGTSNTLDLGRTDPYPQGSTTSSTSYAPVSQKLLGSDADTQDTTFTYTHGDVTVTATVPAGALPAGTRIDVYQGDTAQLQGNLPAGSVAQNGYAIAWTAPDGSHPVPAHDVVVTVHDPSIRPTQATYAATDGNLLTALSVSTIVPHGIDYLAVIDGQDQHIVGETPVVAGQLISGAQVIAAGGGNVIAAGGGNLAFAGGFVIAAGGGNVIAAGGGNVIAAGGGNVIAAGGGNFSLLAASASAFAQINAAAAGVIAAGGGNFNVNQLISTSGSGFGSMLSGVDPQFVRADSPATPSAPTGVFASVSGHDTTVSWTAPTSHGGAPISGYRVHVYRDGDPAETVATSGADTSLTIAYLAAGHSYRFAVEAFNGGYGPASALSAAVSPQTGSAGAGGGSTGGGDAGPGSVPAGGTAYSAVTDGTSPSDAVIAAVTTPNAGTVTFTPAGMGRSQPGYTILDHSFVISAPAASAGTPLQLMFAVADDALPAGADPLSLAVFRDGVLVPPCGTDHATTADPDPCVSSRQSGNGSTVITVLSSHASTWTFGVRPDYVASGPTRILDTRTGTGAAKAQVGPAGTITLTVPNLPAGTSAVVLNLTGTGLTGAGTTFVSACPAAQKLSDCTKTSVLNVTPGRSVPNEITVPVAPDGRITLYNNAGSIDLVADLVGYETGGYAATGPTRVLDTRAGTGAAQTPIGPKGTITLTVPNLPAGTNAVTLNLTATGLTGAPTSYVSACPAAQKLADCTKTSALNATPGQDVANEITVPVAPDGRITLYNNAGHINLVADLVGYTTGGYTTTNPTRILDTRTNAPVLAGSTLTLTVPNLPAGTTAVTLNLTATGLHQAAQTYISACPAAQKLTDCTTTSVLNPTPGTDAANEITVPVAPDGQITLYNHTGWIDLVADLIGYHTT